MNHPRQKIRRWLIVFTILFVGGCAAPPVTSGGPPTVLVSVRIPGGRAPSSQEVTKVYEAIAPEMDRVGFRFARSMTDADYVLTATFTPDPTNPGQGHVAVNSIERTQRVLNGASDIFSSSSPQQQSLQQLDQWARNHSGPDR